MIQRIQSIFLLLAFVLDGSVFFNALYRHAMADPQAWVGIGFVAILIISALASLACIFLYKSRPNQIRWVKITLIAQVVVLGYSIGIFISLGGFGLFLWDEGLGVLLLILALCSQLYARHRIKADEELVRSMDRIR